MRVPVIILDGNQRSALAAVRALGSRGIPVIVGADVPRSLSGVSRFCRQEFVYPSPYHNPDGFLEEVAKQSRHFPEAVLMPMTDVTLSEILRNKHQIPKGFIVPFPEWDLYQKASDKVNLFRQATRLGVPIPRTVFSSDCASRAELLAEGAKLGFPVVLKPAFSRVKLNGNWVNTSVRYASGPKEFQALVDHEPFLSTPFLVQEKIEGPGLGIFLLMDKGRVVTRFAHQRMREKPPSGGVSVLCRSIELPRAALEASCRLLEDYGWNGVAMAEYKLDTKAGVPRLMEINARFWGSLQLAISAGVDFPYLLYAQALGQAVSAPENYLVGVKSRWELGDLDHLIIRFRHSGIEQQLPADAPSKAMVLLNYFGDFLRPSVRHEVLRPNDVRPFVSELRQYIQKLFQCQE